VFSALLSDLLCYNPFYALLSWPCAKGYIVTIAQCYSLLSCQIYLRLGVNIESLFRRCLL
jgi:hypothetical protein